MKEGVQGFGGRRGKKFELGGFTSLALMSVLAGKHIILGLYRGLVVILLSESSCHVAIQVLKAVSDGSPSLYRILLIWIISFPPLNQCE